MTDREKWEKFLTEQRVAWSDTVMYNWDEEHQSGITITSEKREGFVNKGYGGFAADLYFDKDGKLREFGIWE